MAVSIIMTTDCEDNDEETETEGSRDHDKRGLMVESN